MTARDAGWNAAIPPGGTASFPFQASYGGTNPAPAGFRLGGTACAIV